MLCILSDIVVKAVIMWNGEYLMRQKVQTKYARNTFEKQQWGKPQLVIYLSLTMGKYIKEIYPPYEGLQPIRSFKCLCKIEIYKNLANVNMLKA